MSLKIVYKTKRKSGEYYDYARCRYMKIAMKIEIHTPVAKDLVKMNEAIDRIFERSNPKHHQETFTENLVNELGVYCMVVTRMKICGFSTVCVAKFDPEQPIKVEDNACLKGAKMNTIMMKCGHLGPAVGAPGSPAREACEQSECVACVRAKIERKLDVLERLIARAKPKDLPTLEAEYQKLLETIP